MWDRRALGCGLAALISATQVAAEDDSRWSFEAEIEVGVEAIVDADDPDEEGTDVFLSGDVEVEFSLSERLTLFTSLTLESVTDADADRAFEDLGLYVGELGLAIDLDPVVVYLGKISPAFGTAFDSAPGYFGTDLAEDYETEEMIGVMAEVEIGDGVLSLSAFYPDDTRLSDSFGTRRGRNLLSDGGVGNTGKLNNFALQYDHDFDATSLHLGVRHLDRGQEDRDETGVALGLAHALGDRAELIAEYARFDGWEGEIADASIATLGASLACGSFTCSAAWSQRRISGAPTDQLIALGLDYSFANDATVSLGIARTREEGERSTAVAVSLVFPFD